ncbi:MAG: SIMPL domain-containing protein [Treponema sp.]|jgi:uncharacterized protein YggE|nr:SIMPL domain-containing protein [Treponema sp.]
MNKNSILKKLPVLCIGALLLVACTREGAQSTVSVVGIGTVAAQPDMIQILISISQTAQTTRQAQEEVNLQVRRVLALLQTENIKDTHISTPSLRFTQEYEWSGNRRVLVGQKVEQIMTFVIQDLQQDTDKVSRILDTLTEIDHIALNQINFSIKDNQELFIQSRALAYQKALDKARQYAELSGLKVGRALSISELEHAPLVPINTRVMNQQVYAKAESSTDTSGSTIVPSGELEITSQIAVVFLLE